MPAIGIEEEVVALFDELRTPVLRYLLGFGIPVQDAEETLQEVFLALFRHLQDGKPRDNLRGWVFRVAHNGALKLRLGNRRRADRFEADPAALESAVSVAPDPEQTVAEGQRRDRLRAAVRALPEQDQCCLSLRAEGLRYREIAGVLGISLGSVANSLERSLARLARVDGGSK
jgi:RNA polymerase sigma-70 factor (ECF subfamily)